jgi:Tfp pilus assembly protein PilV
MDIHHTFSSGRNSRRNSSGRLFLIEFLIVLFFFLIISTVCVKLFAAAHYSTMEAAALSHAQAAAASVAEALECTDGSADSLLAYFPDGTVLGDSLVLGFDQDFQAVTPDDARYTMTVLLTQTEDHLKQADILVENSRHEQIYALSVSLHQPWTKEEVTS